VDMSNINVSDHEIHVKEIVTIEKPMIVIKL